VRHLNPLLQLILVSITAHAALAGSRVTTSLYALSLHQSEFTVGTLIALFSLLPMFFAVPLGRLVDRIGIVNPMLCGAGLMALGCVLAGALGGSVVLYAAAMLIGTGFMVIQVASQHTVGAMSTASARSSNFSWLALGYSVSSFCGPVIAGFVIDHLGYRASYGIFSGFTLIAIILLASGSLKQITFASHEPLRSPGGLLDLVRTPEMRHIYVIGILLSAAWDLFTFVTPIHGSQLGFSASTIGLILGCFSLATFTIRLAMPWIARRHSEWTVLAFGVSLAVVCYALFPFMNDPVSMMIVAAMLGVAVGSGQPNVLALLHEASPAGRAAEAVGVRVTIGNASQVVLPLAFGAVGASLGLFAVFWGMGAMIGFGVPFAWRKARGK